MFLLLLSLSCLTVVSQAALVVHTKAGPIEGKVIYLPNSTASSQAFLGIPYAESTAGSLRWTDPVAKKNWTGVLNATEFGPGCPQDCLLPPGTCPKSQSEDCLSLNVYRPDTETSNLPVMFFIPGGRFEQGASDTYLYDGRFLTQSEIIVVTINYRLGALGFLYTGSEASGNYGIRDQRTALKWVQDNIAAFGGDPTRVTIDGQSAGASSVAYHILSNYSSGLFSRAIMQSNPSALPLKGDKDGATLGKHFAKALSCDKGDLSCMRGKSVSELLAAEKTAQRKFDPFRPLDVFLPWTPMVGTGGDAIADQPLAMFMNNEIVNRVPFMTGVVANETLIFVYQGLGADPSEALYLGFLADIFNIHAPEVLEQYPSHGVSNRTILHTLSLLGTDYIMACPTRVIARTMPQSWLYYFYHVMSFSKEAWGATYPECWNETCHGEELVFLYGSVNLALPNVTMTVGEKALVSTIQSSWINFVSGLIPQPDWKPFDNTSQSSWLFSTPESPMHTQSGPIPFPRTDKCDFFDRIGYGAAERFIEKLAQLQLRVVKQ